MDSDIAQTLSYNNHMRILTVSDVIDPALTHRLDLAAFGRIALILACGDLPPEYLAYLTGVFKVPLYFVLGNHDIRHRFKAPEGCVDIHAKLVLSRGLRILGLEGCRWYNGGPHQYTEEQMAGILRDLRWRLWRSRGVDIVISHAPPRHIHDAEDRCHRGFDVFHRLIDKYRPRFFIHGHIHRRFDSPEQRSTMVNTTEVINTYGHCVIDIDPVQN
jgi:Icc-related predicted phosphoesterase